MCVRTCVLVCMCVRVSVYMCVCAKEREREKREREREKVLSDSDRKGFLFVCLFFFRHTIYPIENYEQKISRLNKRRRRKKLQTSYTK